MKFKECCYTTNRISSPPPSLAKRLMSRHCMGVCGGVGRVDFKKKLSVCNKWRNCRASTVRPFGHLVYYYLDPLFTMPAFFVHLCTNNPEPALIHAV